MGGYSERNGIMGLCKSRKGSCTSRFQLEMDILVMQKQLQEEKELHAILENALERNGIESSSTSPLPTQAEELLSNISMLEVTVSKLQQEMVSLQFQISQERNERRLAEYHMRHSSPQDTVDSVANVTGNKASMDKDAKTYQPVQFWKLSKTMPPKSLWEHPNKLSEEMVRCMKNIFIFLADSASPNKFHSSVSNCPSTSPRGHLSNPSLWSLSDRSKISPWAQKSPQPDLLCSSSEILATENACDPYSVRGKLSWAEIGNYGSAIEVSWMSVDKKQQEYAAGALRKFRILVEQLAKVNPIHLGSDERLAFWINLYNALIMHAYLAYGVPRSDLKLFSLMQKAAYTVGGHSFTATVIEYTILKMKPPAHRPQVALLLALHKLKVSEEQRKLAIDTFEPLIAFALSTGMHSSPAVRIFTAKNVKEELEEAQRDYIRASVGVSNKGRLLVPKMLHCFARGFVDEPNLTLWISRHLPAHQATFVEQCVSQRRHRLLGSRNCGILSFDSRFRYLFLPEETQS